MPHTLLVPLLAYRIELIGRQRLKKNRNEDKSWLTVFYPYVYFDSKEKTCHSLDNPKQLVSGSSSKITKILRIWTLRWGQREPLRRSSTHLPKRRSSIRRQRPCNTHFFSAAWLEFLSCMRVDILASISLINTTGLIFYTLVIR